MGTGVLVDRIMFLMQSWGWGELGGEQGSRLYPEFLVVNRTSSGFLQG